VAAEPRTAAADPDCFIRDRLTILAYAALASFAYCLYGFGSVLAFLRQELRLSYPVTTLHSVLWAVSGILAGLAFRRLSGVFGRRRVLWGSIAAFCAGVTLLAVAHVLALTLVAATLMGTAGTTMLITTASSASARRPICPRRTR
jgi:MFS family permease